MPLMISVCWSFVIPTSTVFIWLPVGVTTSTLEDAANSDPTAAPPVVSPPADPEAAERRRAAVGLFLIALGAIFLFGNAGVFRIVRWDLIWPLVIIGIGALLLAQRMRR